MTKKNYFVIRVKDHTGDTIKYISDERPEICDDSGEMIISTSTGEVTYNMSYIIFYSIEERSDDEDVLYKGVVYGNNSI